MVHSSIRGEGPLHIQLHDELAVQPAGDAGADAGGKKRILNRGRWRLPFRARALDGPPAQLWDVTILVLVDFALEPPAG